MTPLTQHFTVEEFTATTHRSINNSLPVDLVASAMTTCQMLEAIRGFLGQYAGRDVPLQITSGYRCAQLNILVGGVASSDHLAAKAADFVSWGFAAPLEIAHLLSPNVDRLGIGQLIHEFGRWVHVSTKTPENPNNRVITIDAKGTRVGIWPART